MHVLQVTPYISATPIFGGIPPVVRRISEGLAAAGCEVTIVTSDWGPPVELHSVQVLRVPSILPRLGDFLNTPLTPGMIGLDDQLPRDIDIVHLHGFWTVQNLFGYLLSTQRGVVYVLEPHGSLDAPLGRPVAKSVFMYLFGRRLVREAGAHIALESKEAAAFRRFGIPAERIWNIPNPIGSHEEITAVQQDQSRTIQSNPGLGTVGFLGRLHPNKRVDLLICALARLKAEGHKIACLIAGPDEGNQDSLRSLVATFGLQDSVRFLGVLTEPAKDEFMRSVDALVVPAATGFPVTILEALNRGIPTVVTSLAVSSGDMARSALCVTEDSAEGLSEGILRVLQDEEFRGRLQKQGYNLVSTRHTTEAVIRALISMYTAVIHSASK